MKGKRGSRKYSRFRGPSIAGCPPWGPYDVFLEGILRQSGERKFFEKERRSPEGGVANRGGKSIFTGRNRTTLGKIRVCAHPITGSVELFIDEVTTSAIYGLAGKRAIGELVGLQLPIHHLFQNGIAKRHRILDISSIPQKDLEELGKMSF
jgi:hypothetical protein